MHSQDPIYAGPEPDKNFIQPFRLQTLPVRGRLVRLNSVATTILNRHDYPEPVAFLLAEAVALGVAMASILKADGVFTLQTSGDGPVSMLVCDVNHEHDVRAYAEFNEEAVADLAEGATPYELLGEGYLAFTVEQAGAKESYQGIVALEHADNSRGLAAAVEHYFTQSVQVPTLVHVACDRWDNPAGGSSWRTACLLVQRMPDAAGGRLDEGMILDNLDDGWERTTAFTYSAQPEEMLETAVTAQDLLFRLFHEEGVVAFESSTPRFKCRCSQERVHKVLASFSEETLAEMAENEKIIFTCQFCNEIYVFDVNDLHIQKGNLIDDEPEGHA